LSVVSDAGRASLDAAIAAEPSARVIKGTTTRRTAGRRKRGIGEKSSSEYDDRFERIILKIDENCTAAFSALLPLLGRKKARHA
jgi:hypothetical protein